MDKISLKKYKNITFIVPLYSFLLLILVHVKRYLFFSQICTRVFSIELCHFKSTIISHCVITKSNLAVIRRLSALKINRLTTRNKRRSRSLDSKTHRVSDVIIPMYIAVTLDRRQHVVGWLSAPKEKDNYIGLQLSPHQA